MTVTVPFMKGWNLQKKAKVPAELSVTLLSLALADRARVE